MNNNFLITTNCLSEKIIYYDSITKAWCTDKRYPEQNLYKFIVLNQAAFDFLGIRVEIVRINQKFGLQIITSNFIGCIPLLSPKNGKKYAHLIVKERYGENIEELIYQLHATLSPEFNKEFILESNIKTIQPPLYYECINYIKQFNIAEKKYWSKFLTTTKAQQMPSASTLWEKYAINYFNPHNRTIYENRRNILSTNHLEWQQLLYVLKISLQELSNPIIPFSIKHSYSQDITRLQKKISRQQIEETKEIKTHTSDPIVIKELKQVANRILHNLTEIKYAWRLDIAFFFEKYVQHLIDMVAKEKGATTFHNSKYQIHGMFLPNWSLTYLEPDLIYRRKDTQITIDAKYKSHMYQLNSNANKLKDTFREDLHQILSYSSFDKNEQKKSILVYPCTCFKHIDLHIKTPFSNTINKVILIGIPLDAKELKYAKDELSKYLY